eukprot:c16786_g1_i1 orf=296-844(-)
MAAPSPAQSFPFLFSILFFLLSLASALPSPPILFIPSFTPPMPPAQILLINLILLSNHNTLPPSHTIFLPFNQSLAVAFPSQETRNTLAYHIAFPRLLFKDLLNLPLNSHIPTLFPYRQIVVSRIDKLFASQRVCVDGLEIVGPDLYVDEHVVVHGILTAFDPYSLGLHSSGATKISPDPVF